MINAKCKRERWRRSILLIYLKRRNSSYQSSVRRATERCIVRLPLALRYLILLCSIAFGACADAAPRVLAVDVDSIVHPVTVEIVSRALDQASRENYDLVLIRLNTPGGLMDAMRETIQDGLKYLSDADLEAIAITYLLNRRSFTT